MSQTDIDITEQLKVFEFATASQMVNQALEKSKLVNKSTNNIGGIPSGFSELDKITNGFQKNELSTFAIKKGMGKTAFLLSLINNIAIKNDFSLGVISPERSSVKLINRIIESETGTSVEKINNNDFNEFKKYQIAKTINQISKSKIFIDDTPILQLKTIYQKIAILKNTYNVDVILIDGFNMFTQNFSEKENHIEKVNETMLFFKNISQEYEIPVILFYQIEKPYDEIFISKKPITDDLPGFISKTSDNVYLIDRTDMPYSKEDSTNQKDYCKLIISKQNNNNNPQSIKLKFLTSVDKFMDFE